MTDLRTTRDRAALLMRFYVLASLRMDRQTLGLHHLPMTQRLQLVAAKATALATLARHRPAPLRVGPITFTANSTLDLGSFQSCVVDVHDELVVPDLLSGRAPVVVDVGANVGQFTCATKLFAPDAQIRCFEPDPAIYQSLAANVAALDHVEPRCAGLGAKAETVPFFRHEISLMSTLRPSSAETYDPANTIDVDVLRLDDAVADLDAIDLVKIDVEGLELDVIEGAPETLARTRLLLVELSLGRDDSGSSLSVLDLVRRHAPDARILRFGRPLGPAEAPICQDVLLRLR